MILTQQAIQNIIRNNPNKRTVHAIQQYSEKLTMHITGMNLKKYLARIDYFEKEQLLELRQTYSPGNEDFFDRLHRPVDKVFNAKGGCVNYYVAETDKKKFTELLADVKDGHSLRSWLRTYWLPVYHYDPMGLVVMEVGDNDTYPTYKSSADIYDYPLPKGRKIDYVIFKSEPPEQDKDATTGKCAYYRVIDDTTDRTIRDDGDAITVIDELPNYYGFVPAITVGDIYDNTKQWFVSPDDEVVAIADQHLRDRSVLTMFKLHHGFPIRWQYQSQCPRCKGIGKVTGLDCPACGGTGIQAKYDVSETITIPVPINKDQPVLTPDIAGYITPPVATWQQMDATIDGLFKQAFYALWGTHQAEDSSNSTATGRFIDVQPVNERLACFSKSAEYVEEWITDMMGTFYFQDAYKGCAVNYGRRYLVENVDTLRDKMLDAIIKNSPVDVINALYMQYLESEYEGDSLEYRKQLKLMKIDPYYYLPPQDLKNLELPKKLYYRKLFKQQWLMQLPDTDLINKDIKSLLSDLDTFITVQLGNSNETH